MEIKIGVHFAHLEFRIETETHATSGNIKVKKKLAQRWIIVVSYFPSQCLVVQTRRDGENLGVEIRLQGKEIKELFLLPVS